jgi:hypothetical protein
MLKKVINRIPRAKSTAPVRKLVNKSADTAKKISQNSLVGKATGFLDEALLGRDATKLISMQDAVASRLKKAAIPQIQETYARKVGTGISNAMLRGAGTGAVVGGIYGAFDDDTSVLQSAAKGAMRGAGAGLLYSGYRSRHLLSKLAEHGDDWIVPRSMLSYRELP